MRLMCIANKVLVFLQLYFITTMMLYFFFVYVWLCSFYYSLIILNVDGSYFDRFFNRLAVRLTIILFNFFLFFFLIFCIYGFPVCTAIEIMHTTRKGVLLTIQCHCQPVLFNDIYTTFFYLVYCFVNSA